MTKKPRVPEVLWRLFRNRARTLSATFVSLLPPRPPPGAASLLRSGDSSDYRDLLNHCFAVVSENAPPLRCLSPPESPPESYCWSQHQIVVRIIEMIISEQSVSSNVICSGYDKCNQSSPLVELFTSPAWCLLLERVGEEIMAYLLKHTSIFLPLDHKNYHQVAGFPINELCSAVLDRASKPQSPSYLLIPGPKKKRERDESILPVSKRRHFASSFTGIGISSSVTCFRIHHVDKHSQMNSSEVALGLKGNSVINTKESSSHEVIQNLNQSTPKHRKRSRPCSWQRHRKRRQLDSQEKAVPTSCTSIPTHKNGLPEKCGLKDDEEFMGNCRVRQVARKVTKGAHISRKLLFYNMQCSSSVFPRIHILNSLKPNSSDSMLLFENIFGLSDVMERSNTVPCLENNGFGLSGSASVCLYHSLIKYLKILIRRTRRCEHLRLLNKHCVVPTLDQNAGNSECLYKGSESENQILKTCQDCISNLNKSSLEANYSQAIKSYCPKSQVVSFIWAVCRSIVPADLLGTQTNWRILRRNISKFIQLRRFEHFSLKQCMHKLKTSVFPFFWDKCSFCCFSNQVVQHAKGHSLETSGISKLNDATHTMKQRLLESWIYWFFSYIVVPLLQSNFYITESERGKRDVFYYRKSVWEMVKNRAATCLKDQNYIYLDNAEARDIVTCRSFGFSKLRLLPKENGIRLLANLKASSRMLRKESYCKSEFSGTHKRTYLVKKSVGFHYFRSVNSVLRDTHAVLKGIQLKEPEKLGSSVFDYNDIYKRLCPFLIGLKRGSSTMPAVFMIVSDVSKAFDSVDQNKLLSVIEDAMRDERYTLQLSCQVFCTEKSLSVHENLSLLDRNINSRNTTFISRHSADSILVNQERNKSVKKKELLFHLVEHVKRNVLQLDKKFYLQRVGISQGSVLSSLLCSLYYGDMDRKVIFPFLERTSPRPIQDILKKRDCQHASGEQISKFKATSSGDYMLLRFIDDFLFISTSKQQAENFFSRLLRGFRDYNCYMNEGKFCVNFDIGHILELSSNRLSVGEDGTSFLRWSGLLINCSTLEVQADYTKYLNDHLCSSLTVCWQGKPARHLEAKLCGYMRPKCHPIFYDSNINSAGVVRLNIFQAFLLCAMKFHCYVCDFSYICKFRARTYLSIIERTFRYMHFLIKKRMRYASLGHDLHPILHLEDGEVEWLGLNAYIQVLKRKQSRYEELLSLLRSKLSAHRLSGNGSTHLNYAVDASHSSLMWKIKF